MIELIVYEFEYENKKDNLNVWEREGEIKKLSYSVNVGK